MPLHCAKLGEHRSSSFSVKVGKNVQIVPCTIWPQFDVRRLFVMLAFCNGLEYRNFDFSVLIGNYFCTLCRNFVIFNSLRLEKLVVILR